MKSNLTGPLARSQGSLRLLQWIVWVFTVTAALCLPGLGPIDANAQLPSITRQPQDVFAAQGGSAAFTVEATGDLLSYQWFHVTPGSPMPEPVPDGTNATLLLINLQPSADGEYYVVVGNPVGFAVSDPASLLVYPLPTKVQLYCRDGKPITNCVVTITLTNSSGYSSPKIANSPAGIPSDNWFWTCFFCQGLDPSEQWWFLVTASCCTNAWLVPTTTCYGEFDGLICDSCGDCPAPRITCPNNLNVLAPCNEPCIPVVFPNPAVLNGVLAGCNPPSGTCFPVGTTPVACTATNKCGDAVLCEFTVTVKPCLICPRPKTVECGSRWDFDPPTVEPGCAPIQYGVLNTTTNGTCPMVITRTWSVVASCGGGLGLVTQCQQIVSVVDTTPPLLVCAPDKSVSCGDDWSFDPPAFQDDGCSPISVQVLSTVTNFPCTAQAAIVRTWLASDACGNTSQCSQTVYLDQSAPIVVTCPPDKQVECTLDWGFDRPIVRSPCGTATISVLNTVTNGSCPVRVTRTWSISDGCGHQITCSQTVTLLNAASLQTAFVLFSGSGPSGLLPLGAPDPQFTLTCAPPGVTTTVPIVTQPNPLWLPNGPQSQWIGPSPSNLGPAGLYCYEYKFELPRCSKGTPVYAIKGRWSGDDTGVIELNGAPTGAQLPIAGWGFTNWHPINITSGLVPGLNTLTFYVTNASYGPTGLRVEIAASVLCCGCTNDPCVVSIRCPNNVTNQTCGATAVVNYLAPTASSTCGPIANVLCVPPSASAFPLGSTTVTCTATDAQGNAASCSFTVQVNQAASPWQVICPPLNQSVTGCPPVMPDLTAQVGILTNCPLPCPISITQSIPAGTVLTPGQHVVVIRVCDCTGVCRDCDVIITAVPSPGCCNTDCTLRPVLNLFSGRGPAGLLPGGSTDPQFQTGIPPFATSNPYVPAFIHWLWMPNGPNSQWIGPVPGFQGSAKDVFIYTNRFFLCSTQLAAVTGRWAGDDSGEIWLNGAPTGNPLPNGWAFLNWTPVSITSGFVPGWNELTFRVTNSLANSVTGLRVELNGRACCNTCVSIHCPENIVTNACHGGATVSWAPPIATSQCGVITSMVCQPPAGSAFPAGVTVVNCTAIDSCGNAANCRFTVTVKPDAPPAVLKCPPDRTLFTCSSGAVVHYNVSALGAVGPITCTPPSGSTFPIGTTVVTCSAVNACGQVTTCSFKVTVKHYTVGPPWWNWPCDRAVLADGLAHLPRAGAILSSGPIPDLPGIGLIGGRPPYSLVPAPGSKTAEVTVLTGNAQFFAFTTVLDVEAPDGSTIEIIDPTDPAGVPLLTLQKGSGGSAWNCKGCCHWDLKKCKGLISDDPAFRTSAVNNNGDLLGSFTQTFNEGNTNAALSLWVTEDGDITKFPITLVFNRTDGTIHVDFPGEVIPAGVRDARRKGWDGVVKGRPPTTARKGWDGTVKGRPPTASRVTFSPVKPHAVHGEIMNIVATGLPDLCLTEPVVGVMGDATAGQPSVFDGPRGESTAYPLNVVHRATEHGDGIQWTSLADDTGVFLDLGRAAGVDVAFEHTPAPPSPDGSRGDDALEFRVSARGIRPPVLINRPEPPPATAYLRLAQGPAGIACTVDLSYLGATDIAVQYWLKGELKGQTIVKGPSIRAEDKLFIDRWPTRFAQLGVNGVLRLSGEFAGGPDGASADEIRFVPTIPADLPLPDSLGALECTASAGVDGILRDLRSTRACVPGVLNIDYGPTGVTLNWTADGQRLQGAESVEGPWLDLGDESPTTLPAHSTMRVFRLICE